MDNDNTIYNETFNSDTFESNICGRYLFKDKIIPLLFTLPHSRSDLVIIFTTNLTDNAYNNSWGIRDLFIMQY